MEEKYNFVKNDEALLIDNGHVCIDVKMFKPIVKAREEVEVVEKIGELIPERGSWPRIERGADHAVLFLKSEVKKLAEFILDKILDFGREVFRVRY